MGSATHEGDQIKSKTPNRDLALPAVSGIHLNGMCVSASLPPFPVKIMILFLKKRTPYLDV